MLMKVIKNEKITLGLVATASPLIATQSLDTLVSHLEKYQFCVKVGHTASQRHGYLAGSDESRAVELMGFFQDRSVDAIIALRGGYGSMRILPFLDFSVIRKNKKPFIGFSDNTALHAAFNRCARMVSFHGPNGSGLIAKGASGQFARQMLRDILQALTSTISLRSSLPRRAKQIDVLCRGKAKGRLVGGNLALLAALCGTPFFPDMRDAILFIEDVGEVPYRVDRMLTQLRLSGSLSKIAGIAIGSFTDCQQPSKQRGRREYHQTIEDVLVERLADLGVPIINNVPIGHGVWNATLPLGAVVELDAQKGDLLIPRVSSLAIR
jgi:muramoyltetrapeptide carboxypeptidase